VLVKQKKDLELYELQQDNPLSLNKTENSHTYQVNEDSTLLVTKRDNANLLAQENQFENETHPWSLILENKASPFSWDSTS